jgi:hypothetical protein
MGFICRREEEVRRVMRLGRGVTWEEEGVERIFFSLFRSRRRAKNIQDGIYTRGKLQSSHRRSMRLRCRRSTRFAEKAKKHGNNRNKVIAESNELIRENNRLLEGG